MSIELTNDEGRVTKEPTICATRDCGEMVKDGGKVCFYCRELENNRRYRQHHGLGEYAPEAA